MTTKNKDVDKIIYSYTTNSNELEEENKLLRETVSELREELEKFKEVPLMLCQVKEVLEEQEQAVIQIPNGNEFMVNVTSSCKKLKPGDTVLVEQKNLTIIKKIPNR